MTPSDTRVSENENSVQDAPYGGWLEELLSHSLPEQWKTNTLLQETVQCIS